MVFLPGFGELGGLLCVELGVRLDGLAVEPGGPAKVDVLEESAHFNIGVVCEWETLGSESLINCSLVNVDSFQHMLGERSMAALSHFIVVVLNMGRAAAGYGFNRDVSKRLPEERHSWQCGSTIPHFDRLEHTIYLVQEHVPRQRTPAEYFLYFACVVLVELTVPTLVPGFPGASVHLR